MLPNPQKHLKHWMAGLALGFSCCFVLPVGAQAVATNEPSKDAKQSAEVISQQLAFGTGFSLGNGYVLTAYHVVKNIPKVLVGQPSLNKWTVSEVIKTDSVLDLALIKTPLDLPALKLATSDQVPIGLEVSVIGYPLPKIQGMTPKITQGIINGYPNLKQQDENRGYFQISAEVSRGNSGGPVLGPDATVIGIVQRKLDAQRVMDRTQEWIVNISYALRSAHILEFLQDTPVNPQVKKPDLQQQLRPYQIYEQVNPGVVSIIASPNLLNAATIKK